MPAAIFDMDGVLVDSNPAHFQAWKAFGKQYGIEIDEATYAKYINGRRNDEFLEELYPGRWSYEERLRIAAEKEAFYREHLAAQVPPVPGVVETIRALAERQVPLAVATSGPRENAELITEQLGVRPLFQVLVSGHDVPLAKPDPTIFLEAARRLGVPPAQCVVFEDSPAGVEAAIRAGAYCVGLATSEPAEVLKAKGAHDVISDFTRLDLEALLARLAGRA
ncbi:MULTISPECIES: HAD family hydrolase [Limnochorda]|uniref:HAD family hydrolase n=1 Tax=Limnochorda TaxID=1676651 RepID=UPI0026EE7B62|nr:HAD family phosphatase [Limnochorda pilosa]